MSLDSWRGKGKGNLVAACAETMITIFSLIIRNLIDTYCQESIFKLVVQLIQKSGD